MLNIQAIQFFDWHYDVTVMLSDNFFVGHSMTYMEIYMYMPDCDAFYLISLSDKILWSFVLLFFNYLILMVSIDAFTHNHLGCHTDLMIRPLPMKYTHV